MFQCLVGHHLPCTKNLLSILTNVSGELASLGMQWNVVGDAKWCTRRKERESMRMQKNKICHIWLVEYVARGFRSSHQSKQGKTKRLDRFSREMLAAIPFESYLMVFPYWHFDLAFNFQAENIYNDEELDTPASELEAGASWVNNMRWNLSICSLSSDFRAMFVLKWWTSVSCTKYR